MQLAGFMVWSWVLAHRFSITWDFAVYQQAAWLIGHGHLDPYSSLLSKPFWKNDGEFILWPLALLVRVGPNLVTLPWVQDIALTSSEVIALLWMCDIAAQLQRRTFDSRLPIVLVALGIVLMVGNPWFAWTVSFDFHMEPLIAVFVLACARDLYRGRRRAWIWVAGVLLCGSVGAGYVGMLGLSALLSGRWLLRRGAIMMGAGFLLLLTFAALHATPQHVLDIYAPLAVGNAPIPPAGITVGMVVKGILGHPLRDMQVLWSHKANIWGDLSPGGLIGIFWLPVTFPSLLVLAEGGVGSGTLIGFETPGFQNIVIAPMMALGTVALLAAVIRRRGRYRRWLIRGLLATLAANAIVWSTLWIPQVSRTWLDVSPAAASTLKKVLPQIGHGDEVLVSQGIVGAFSERKNVYVMFGPELSIPVRAHKVWIILSPLEGIEVADSAAVYSDIATLTKNPAMHVVAAANGVWAFEWLAPPGVKTLKIAPSTSGYVPGWVSAGEDGQAVTKGGVADWSASNTSEAGYVIDGSYWRGLQGLYRATLRISVSAGTYVNAEVWDSTRNVLLARRAITDTHGVRTVSVLARLRVTLGQPAFGGHALWAIRPLTRQGDELEIRVWSPGTGRVRVFRIALEQLTGKHYLGESTVAAQFGVAGG